MSPSNPLRSPRAERGEPKVSGPLLLRTVKPDDVDLGYLAVEQQSELHMLYGEPDLEPDMRPEEILTCVVGYVDGEPVACGVVRRREDAPEGVGEIKRMYTDPPFRSRGYGHAVLDALLEAARGAGLRRLELETGVRQPYAIAMYERAGFVPIASFGPYAERSESRCFAIDL